MNRALPARTAPNRNVAIKQSRRRVADVLATHPALKDLRPASNQWELQRPGTRISSSTEELLSHWVDGFLAYGKRAGIEGAAHDCDTLLTKAALRSLSGYELTFVEGLQIAECWKLAPRQYLAPCESVRKRSGERLEWVCDPFALAMDPERMKSLAVLVREFRWGPVVSPVRSNLASDFLGSGISFRSDPDPLRLVARLAVALKLPLSVRVGTQLAAPWVEDLLNLNLKGAFSHSSPPAGPVWAALCRGSACGRREGLQEGVQTVELSFGLEPGLPVSGGHASGGVAVS